MAVVSAEKEYNCSPVRGGTRSICRQRQPRRSPGDVLHLEVFVSYKVQRGIRTPWENIERNT